MESARRNNTCAPLNVYEQQRNANIAIVDAKLKSLNIPRLTKELKDQPKKRKKRTHTVVTETEAHNLRPRPPRNSVEDATEEIDEDLDCEPTGDFLCPNEDVPRKKRGGRGITRMEEVFARTPDMAKVKVDLNEFDQPVGSRARELASVIGCLVRKISVQCSDWRLVDIKKKDALWKEIKVRTKTAKANRAKLAIHHTSGTKSFARARHELGRLLQRPPRRDEVYIKTHTRKNGVPTKNAEPIINKLKEIVEACPELKERTIEQGDALAAACGAKEPRGRVRALGLGPTPQDIGVAGLKCYQSTRFQMEVLARKEAEQRIAELEEQMKRQEERHAEERQNFMEVMSHNGSNSRQHVSPRSIENIDAHHHDAHFEEDADCGDNEDHEECPEEDGYLFVRRHLAAQVMHFHQHSPTSAANTVQTHATSPHQCTPNDTTLVTQRHASFSGKRFANNAAPTVQHGAAHEDQPHATSSRHCIPDNVLPAVQPDAAHEMQPDAAKQAKHVQPHVGMNVILYEVVRSNARVALGTIVSTNPKTIIGGVALGKQYCEVIVNHVLKRDAALPRTYPGVEKMADAHKLSIAWPYNRVKQQASKLPQAISEGREKS